MVTQHQPNNPAELLLDLELDGGWTVVERLIPPAQSTGGAFSISYAVESPDGERAFLKALDYSSAFQQPNTPSSLNAMTSAYLYELKLLNRCAAMSRVVKIITYNKVEKREWYYPVDYFIFEWATQDSRAVLNTLKQLDILWCLRTLHNIAVGLQQLHLEHIVHQDLKPSNVLIFKDKGAKIADLGRASYRGDPGPFDEVEIPGDLTYAPPELLYNYVDKDWAIRRLASDIYQLGSLIMFFFTRLGTTSAILAHLNSSHAPNNWLGTFHEVLPFIRQAFIKSLETLKSNLPDGLKSHITQMVSELCDPDPKTRGHPRNRINVGNQYGLERYVSLLDLLNKKVELRLIRIEAP